MCIHLNNNVCTLASSLIQEQVVANEQACSYCQSDSKPMQINSVVAGIAILQLATNSKPIPATLLALVDSKRKPPKQGPGTELKKLISWFIYKREVQGCRTCYDRETQMNEWGPNGCRENIQTIVEWLRESATKHSLPFSETLVKILINKAIRNSEKHYEVVRSSNNCTT